MTATTTTRATPAPAHPEAAPPDLVIPVAGHILDYRDTAEIAGIVRALRDLGFVPWAEYRAARHTPRPHQEGHR